MSEDIGEKIKSIVLVILAILFSLLTSLWHLVLALIPRSFRRRSVSGQVVLVTGGGSGIGRLLCTRFASRGAKVVTWDVNSKGNQETVKLIKKEGGKCFAYTVDLCDRASVYEIAKTVKKEVGKVDILINNAGIVTGRNFINSPDESIIKCFDVNVISHFWTLKAFLPDMMKANSGHIVTIASLAGYIGCSELVDYSSSKFAALGLDNALREELYDGGYSGIRTTVVCPYYINTGMFDGVKSRLLPILEPEEVADEITDAILLGKQQLIMPRIANLMVALKGLLTCQGLIYLEEALGLNEAMKEFTGRKKQ